MDFQASASASSKQGDAAAEKESVAASPRSPNGATNVPETTATSFDETPARYWEDAQNEFGEVDLEAFKGAAGEVLDRILLDMMDDVVAGRLNWMRPLPRVRPRR